MSEKLLSNSGIKDMPERFYNLDETGLALDPKKKTVFFHQRTKNAQMIVPTEGKIMYTVLLCGNAAENYLPPYVIYKGQLAKVFDTLMIGGPPDTGYNISRSCWMEEFVFEAWFKGVVLKAVEDLPKPIVLFFNGHGSHLSYETALKAKEADAHIVCLPPRISNALQPLDVEVYGPAKEIWYNVLQMFCRESRQQTESQASISYTIE